MWSLSVDFLITKKTISSSSKSLQSEALLFVCSLVFNRALVLSLLIKSNEQRTAYDMQPLALSYDMFMTRNTSVSSLIILSLHHINYSLKKASHLKYKSLK